MQNIEGLCMGCMNDNGGEQICSVCGFDVNSKNEPNALELRTLLAGRYIVGKVINSNGEGYTYLGFDTVTEAVVKITEYFPTGLCNRLSGGVVEINGEKAFAYNEGIIKFINLYKNLGMLSDVSAVYRVIDIFETNKTAYTISEHLPGITLKEFLIRNGGLLTWEQVKPLFLPLVTAFKTLHSNGIIHGGISPETLIVGRDGRVRISDFCIPDIRTAKTEMNPQLFTGFAAIEQYRGEELTPKADVYAFAATMFRTLTGNPPPDSLQRIETDNLTFSKSIAETMPRGVLVTMANALQIEPMDRTANMDELREDLQLANNNEPAVESTKSATKGAGSKKSVDKAATRKYTLFAALATAVILALLSLVIYLIAFKPSDDGDTSSVASMPSMVSVGDIGQSEKPESYFSVPDFSGSTYASLLENDEYTKWFEFKVVKKEYNNKVGKGKICGQSVAVGTSAKEGTAIELVISLGPSEVTIPKKLEGMSKTEAYITLLELGFEPQNIEFIEKKAQTATKEEVVIETVPTLGERVSPDSAIIVYYNTNLIVEDVESDYYDFDLTD